MAMRVHPTDYYSIADSLYHQLYEPGPSPLVHFPLIFYIWLLAPNIQDIKWLYLVFALGGTIASYFTVATITKQRLLAALSAAWVAYFLQTNIYFMFEYWAVTVFLIGLAFFVSERHVPAAAVIGVATLIKEVFAPFLVIASIYYVSQVILKNRREKGRWTFLSLQEREARTLINKAVWWMATLVVGIAYFLNGHASSGSFGSPIERVHFFRVFDPSVLTPLIYGPFFRYPPLPLILTVGLAFIGMYALANWDHRIIVSISFAAMILMMVTSEGVPWEVGLPQRYISMPITLINLFWLVGIYKIAEYPVRRVSSLRRFNMNLAAGWIT
jgi:hypothetical protein